MIVGATTLKGAVGISVPSTLQFAITQLQQNDQQLILKKAQQIFDIKQKLKNNCSGFAASSNTATTNIWPLDHTEAIRTNLYSSSLQLVNLLPLIMTYFHMLGIY
jgi:hypothetical protein